MEPLRAYGMQGCGSVEDCMDVAVDLYKDGHMEEALNHFIYISEEGKPPLSGIASFMAGYIMDKMAIDGALPYIDRAIALAPPVIANYALFMKGRDLENKDPQHALIIFKEILKKNADKYLKGKALLEIGDIYIGLNRIDEAIGTYKKLMSLTGRDQNTPAIMYRIGLAHILKGDREKAFQVLKGIWISYPLSKEASMAGKVLSWLNNYRPLEDDLSDEELLIRADRLYRAALYGQALRIYRRVLTHNTLDPAIKRKVRFHVIKSLYNLRKTDEAEDEMKDFLKTYRNPRFSPEVLYLLGRNYLRQGREDEFIRVSKEFIRRYGAHKKAPEVMYRLAVIYSDRGETKKALSIYGKIARRYPHDRFAYKSQWAKGWLFYKQRHLRKAIRTFDSIIRSDSPYAPRAFYWKARALQKLHYGNRKIRRTICRLCKLYKDSFYCILASYHKDLYCPAEAALNRTDSPSIDGEAIPIDHKGIFQSKIKLLVYLGFIDEAFTELRSIRHMSRKDIVELVKMLNSAGEYYKSFRLLSIGGGPSIQRLLYPEGYKDEVITMADKFHIDPHLVYAIMREESRFNKEAVSSAGAIGLMQLMPETAIRMDGSISREDLFDPGVNIHLGTIYLAELLKRFGGNIFLAIGAYNAGPEAVTRWIEERKDFTIDEFIEDIPYRETRGYVKKVFKSYVTYKRLSGEPRRIDTISGKVYSLSQISTSYE